VWFYLLEGNEAIATIFSALLTSNNVTDTSFPASVTVTMYNQEKMSALSTGNDVTDTIVFASSMVTE
jgi:hypothetical protein